MHVSKLLGATMVAGALGAGAITGIATAAGNSGTATSGTTGTAPSATGAAPTTAQSRRVGARRPFDQHLDRAPDEALRALARVALDELDEPLHPLDLHRVRNHPVDHGRGLGSAAW